MSIYSIDVPKPEWLDGEDYHAYRDGFLDAAYWVSIATPDELASMTTSCTQNTIEPISVDHSLARVWGYTDDDCAWHEGDCTWAVGTMVDPRLPLGVVNFRDDAYGAGFAAALENAPTAIRIRQEAAERSELEFIASHYGLTPGQAREVLDLIKRLHESR